MEKLVPLSSYEWDIVYEVVDMVKKGFGPFFVFDLLINRVLLVLLQCFYFCDIQKLIICFCFTQNLYL